MNGRSVAVSKIRHLLIISAAASIAPEQCESLLRCCITAKSLVGTKQIHAHAITSGFLSSNFLAHLTAAYALCGHQSHARKLFDELPRRTLLSYNSMIRMYAECGSSYRAIRLFAEMLGSVHPKPNEKTYPFVIRACGDSSLLALGVPIHALIVTTGFISDIFVGNSLLAMYMNCGDKLSARRVFNAMQKRTVVSWNTMISGYFRNGSAAEALMVFKEMADVGEEADSATVVSVLPACGYLKNLDVGRDVNALVQEKGLGNKLSVRNALIDMYVKCGRMDEALLVFSKMGEKDVVTWTTMINGYVLEEDAKSAFRVCHLMQLEGVRPNCITLASLLSACADKHLLKHGKCLHGWATRQDLEYDVNVETALIDMYAKCNSFELGFRVFTRTPEKRTIPWNAVLSGCVHNKLETEAILRFKELLLEEVDPNVATLKSILPAYAILADLRQAMNIHSYLTRSGFLSKIEIASGLIDIYFKCGNIESAHKIFNGIPMKDKDIILWSVMIAGYGTHGHGEAAVSLFNQMVQAGVKPNEVTFTSVLHACSHAGLVDDGMHLFRFMLKNQYINPRTDHYTCIVDMLGRAGRLEEAYELIRTMPFQPSHTVWGALLGACVIHENVELGEVAAKSLFELEPENTGNYILMSKIYSALGKWEEAENVRRMMNEIGLTKSPASSLIQSH